jgi:RecB family endonuclease NucS
MQSDMLMFTIVGADPQCVAMPSRQLAELGTFEPTHLERWIVDHPEVLGDYVKIVTTQYDKWSSISGDLARERLDLLGLDKSGQLVVVEPKRGTDSRIHLQAITYAALVAGFSKETLADAHAD